MPTPTALSVYLAAAILFAMTPGPGMIYILTRSLKGGRGEGYTSSLGTAVGGLFHVVAAALGLSAILASSALAFELVKYLGAAYLIYLGIRTILRKDEVLETEEVETGRLKNAFSQGVVTEVLNPKTALFFLAFIPQFINPQGSVVLQFILLGSLSVFLNTLSDFVVATLAGSIGSVLKKYRTARRAQKMFTGGAMIALGVYVAFAGGDHNA